MEESTLVNGWIAEALAPLLLRLGTQRFGEPSEKIANVIGGIKDRALLERMFDRVLKAADWTDLLDAVSLRDQAESGNGAIPHRVQKWITLGEARMVWLTATRRFDRAPVEVQRAVLLIADPERLERMMERLIDATATGWDDLLATT